ncbi:putative ubiquinone biosynthesis monooxygenase [Coemansia sp. RSA 2618]|nr:putative ubiquinone biosynthesis monooxygenase [Coemansia sp. RSA 2618]
MAARGSMKRLLSLKTPAFTGCRAFATQQSAIPAREDLYDVAIVGGGPAGCALATALGTSSSLRNTRVALVDPGKLRDVRTWEPPLDTYLARTLQITAQNQRYLEQMGAWQLCFEDRVQACSRAVVGDALGGSSVDLMSRDGDAAYMIETKNLVSGLLRRLEHTNVDVIERTRVTNIDTAHGESGWPAVALSNGRSVRARLVVGADGAGSPVRKHARIDTYGTEYAQYGLVATLCLEGLSCTAYQRFLPTGPIALLPFPGGFANLIWSLDTELVQLLKGAHESVFPALVNAAFRLQDPEELEHIYAMLRAGADADAVIAEIKWRLDVASRARGSSVLPPVVAAVSPRSRTTFPLRMRVIDSLVAGRVALVGDAGHVMHPLAGQGLNVGLSDVRCLAHVLEQAACAGEDLGTMAVLDRYNRERYARNLAMQGIIDKVWHVFGARSGAVAALRSLAMDGLDRVPVIKNQMIRAFMQ